MVKLAMGSCAQNPDVPGHPQAHLTQCLRLPVGGGQRDRWAGPESGVPGTQYGRVRATKGLDRNVGVADQDEVDVGAPNDPQQPGGSWCQLLGVVDHDQRQARGNALRCLGVGLEQVGSRAQDRRGVIGARTGQSRHLVVLSQQLSSRHPVGSTVRSSQRREPTGVQAALDRSHEQIPQLRAKAPGGQGGVQVFGPVHRLALTAGVSGQQLTENDILLRTAEEPGAGVPAQGSGLAQNAETQRLVSPGQRLGRGAPDPGGDAFAQVSGRDPGSRQDQALIGRDPVTMDPLDHHLDGGRCLAGARSAQHAKDGSIP